MSGYQQYINDFRVSQHREDRVREGSTERALGAMRIEQQRDRVEKLSQMVGANLRPSRFHHAWSSLITSLASFLG